MNVSRGAIVKTDALIARAKRGDIRVSLDVFDPEPLPDGHSTTSMTTSIPSCRCAWIRISSASRSVEGAVQRERSHSALSTGTPIPFNQQGEVFKELANINQYKTGPGAAAAPAPDGSNVWSDEEREELGCLESDRSVVAPE